MKLRVFFIASLGLNLALAAAFLALWRNRSVPTTGNPLALGPAVSIPEISNVTRPPAPVAVDAPATTIAAFHWRMIESDDYRQYIANLRAVGCPERTIRDIIVADIDQLYAAKGKSAPLDFPPWQNADRRRAEERSQAARRTGLQAEKRALVKELIGYEWDNHANEIWHEDFETGLLLGFLPELKAPQLMALVEKYTELGGNVKTEANDILIDEDRARLRKLYDNLRTEVAQLLGPSEREELELRVQAGIFLPAENIHWDGIAISGAETARIRSAVQRL
jgi:hypothetical protein